MQKPEKLRGRKPVWGSSVTLNALAKALGVHWNTVHRWVTTKGWIDKGVAVQPGGRKGTWFISREFIVKEFGEANARKCDREMAS